MATGALKPTAVGKYKGDLFYKVVGDSTWNDAGAVVGLVGAIDGTEITEIKSDNRGTLVKFADLKVAVNVTSKEPQDADKLVAFYNAISTIGPGTPITIPDEEIGADVPAGTVYILKNKNGNNTLITPVVITDGDGVFNASKYVVDLVNGETRIVFIEDTTGATTINYTYTPNESKKATLTAGTNELVNFAIMLKAVEGTKIRTLTISSCTLNSTYNLGFVDIVEAGNTSDADLTFESNSGALIEYYDEILS